LTLIESLSRYRNRHGDNPTVTWIGRIQEPAYYDKCNMLLQQAQLVDSWRWLAEREEIQQLYKQHDALIHPSLYEGCPNAICEAMACGMPVLAGRVGDHERFISDCEGGFLFDPTSVQSMCSALEEFSALSTERRMMMGRHSRSVAEREFSPNRLVDAYETLFQRLTKNGPSLPCS
jgi:glycosyltransferase involved in cell wall biosynthesis